MCRIFTYLNVYEYHSKDDFQCDELEPQCLRCIRRGITCQYQKVLPKLKLVTEQPQELQQSQPNDFPQMIQGLTMLSPSYSMASSGPLLSVSSNPPTRSISPFTQFNDGEMLVFKPPKIEMLDSKELDLLSHYLSHTASSMAFDREDLEVLKVGIANLAFQSKPVMNSILSLAAVCKCRDILDQPIVSPQYEAQIRDLMAFADQHHIESLQQIQAYAADVQYYDYVMVNAALMVQYGGASHSTRIRLVEMMPSSDPLPSELRPALSQWISIIRAVHVAFTGLRNDQPDMLFDQPELQFISEQSFKTYSIDNVIDTGSMYWEDALSPQSDSLKETEGLLMPIVAATANGALEKLELRARCIYAAEEDKLLQAGVGQAASCQLDLQACLEAIKALRGWPQDYLSMASSSAWSQSLFSPEDPPLAGLAGLPPWLRNYLARVTEKSPPCRTAMFFISQVPPQYLDLVQTILDRLPHQNGGDDYFGVLHYSEPGVNGVAQRLAVDIFAHWLVLVMLLEGVWWIGGIGAWELGRVVAAMQMTEDWWPESMYKVWRELGKHKER